MTSDNNKTADKKPSFKESLDEVGYPTYKTDEVVQIWTGAYKNLNTNNGPTGEDGVRYFQDEGATSPLKNADIVHKQPDGSQWKDSHSGREEIHEGGVTAMHNYFADPEDAPTTKPMSDVVAKTDIKKGGKEVY